VNLVFIRDSGKASPAGQDATRLNLAKCLSSLPCPILQLHLSLSSSLKTI
jgi:hypothetical protein